MGATQVTNAQYAAFDPGHRWWPWDGVSKEELASHPVVNVSWCAAMSFCRWLGASVPSLVGVRLPTEEEWEYFCRAGSQSLYWSGDSEEDLAEVGWYDENSGGRTHRVGRKKANLWGIHDVHGNVDEWTLSQWRIYTADTLVVDPGQAAADLAAPLSGDGRVIRGGTVWDTAVWTRAACRGTWNPEIEGVNLGFRVVLPLAAPEHRS